MAIASTLQTYLSQKSVAYALSPAIWTPALTVQACTYPAGSAGQIRDFRRGERICDGDDSR